MKHTQINETNPLLSETCKNYIKIHLSPSYWNEDEQVHALDYVFEILTDEVENKGDILGITFNDIKVLNELMEENIDYIILKN